MKTRIFSRRGYACVRLCASVLAVMATVPVLAQDNVPALDEVVVTATRFAANSNTLPFGVSVITQLDLARSGVTTINEALAKLLGIQSSLDFYGASDNSLDLRGFGATASSNQVVVVDGVRMNDADLSSTRLAGIAINSVQRIEILRGSGSVLYGQGATGGVVVITTNAGKGISSKNAADLYAATGTYGLNEVRGNATLVSGGFSMDMATNKRQADNHRDSFRSSAEGHSVQTQWRNDWLRLGISHATDMLDSGLPGSLTAAQYDANPQQTSIANSTKTGNIQSSRQTIFASAELGAWQLGLDAGQRNKQLDSKNKGVAVYSYDVDASTLALKAQHASRLGTVQNALTLGYDQGDWKRIVPGASGSVSRQKNSAIYTQDTITLPTGIRFSAGYRLEHVSQTDTGATLDQLRDQQAWELGLTKPLSSGLTLYGRLGNSFRMPNFDEVGYIVSGTLLQAQTARDMELGSRWKYASGRVDVRFYRSQLNNELGYDPSVANPQSWDPTNLGANVNFDPTLRQGLELETQHDLSKSLGLQMNLGIREATFMEGTHNGKTVPLVAGTTLALRADWRPKAAHAVNAGVVWASSQYVDFNNTCKVPSHATVDARYAYQWDKVELSLGGSNLFDRKFYNLAYGCNAGVTTSIYPEAGRAFTAAMRMKF